MSSTTKPTAWSPRSTRSRCRSSSARSRARRDGRSRTSSKPSRPRPGSTKLTFTSGASARSRRSLKLEPVALAGVTISNASLHNLDEIRRKDVREGDTVLIERAGDVIPYVVRVTREGKPRAKEFQMPAHCPECGGAIVHEEGEVGYFCVNVNCPARDARVDSPLRVQGLHGYRRPGRQAGRPVG